MYNIPKPLRKEIIMENTQLHDDAISFVKSLSQPFLLCVWSHYAKANNKPEILVNADDNIAALFGDVRCTVKELTQSDFDRLDRYIFLDNDGIVKSIASLNSKISPFDRTALIKWLATDDNLAKETAYFMPQPQQLNNSFMQKRFLTTY